MDLRKSQVQVGESRYAYIEAGEGPLLLFGHGTFGGKELFEPQLDQLSPHFRCVALDWLGHGESNYRPGGWRVEDLVADVPGIIDALGVDSAFLAGVSQGGAVFTRVALQHPERAAALINMSAGPMRPPEASLEAIRRFGRVLRDETDEVARRQAVEAYAPAWHAPGFAERLPEATAAEINVVLGHPREAAALIPEVPAHYRSIMDRLGEISRPTLVIWGLNDFRPELGAEIAAATPGAELVEIPNAGHHVNVDAPEETSEAILRFLHELTQG